MATLTNMELRNTMSNLGVKQWMVAEQLGISEQRLSVMFRHELSKEDSDRVKAATLIAARRLKSAKVETPESELRSGMPIVETATLRW